ncbi:MAG: YybH family protein [Blastocatellia bacterium]
MRKILTIKLAAALALMIFICAVPAVAQPGDVRAAIEAQNKKFIQAVEKGDAKAIADLYTANAMVLPSNSEIVKGQDAIKAVFQGLIDSGVKGGSLTTIEVERFGDTVNEVGVYTLKDASGKEIDKGKYIVIWKRENGQWRLHLDIFNTSMPPPAK